MPGLFNAPIPAAGGEFVKDTTGNIKGMIRKGAYGTPDSIDYQQRPHTERVATIQSVTKPTYQYARGNVPSGYFRNMVVTDATGNNNTREFNEADWKTYSSDPANQKLFQSNPQFKHLFTPTAVTTPQLKEGGGIHIKPENKGKFTATKSKTGKSTEELTHSKNPTTKKRAVFAQNAARWSKKSTGGLLIRKQQNK
jgi:hypothetical protein